MTGLPRPKVEVSVEPADSTGHQRTKIAVGREAGKITEIEGAGWSEAERTRKVVEQIIDSRSTAELLPGKDDAPRDPPTSYDLARDRLVAWITEGT